jgi:hypothetical protein
MRNIPRPLAGKSALAVALSAFTAAPSVFAAPGDPLGPAIDITSPLADYQFGPAVARNASGNLVVAWLGNHPSADILAQRFDASGAPQGGAFIANTTGGVGQPAVAMDADGDFVIAWLNSRAAHEGGGIYARRFKADGTALGAEQLVTDGGNSMLDPPSVAMDPDGDFVVTWSQGRVVGTGGLYFCSYLPLCFGVAGSSVRARRFKSDGTADGSLITVDATPQLELFSALHGSEERKPVVAMNEDGSFVVAWQRAGNGPRSGLFVRRYPVEGRPALPQTVARGGVELAPGGVATNGGGSFAVAYYMSAGAGIAVEVRPYGADGTPQSAALRADDGFSDDNIRPSIAMDAAGDFVAVWEAWPSVGIRGQRFASGGGALGGNFALSTDCCGTDPTVASDAAGNFAAAWEEAGHIKLRLYAGP